MVGLFRGVQRNTRSPQNKTQISRCPMRFLYYILCHTSTIFLQFPCPSKTLSASEIHENKISIISILVLLEGKTPTCLEEFFKNPTNLNVCFSAHTLPTPCTALYSVSHCCHLFLRHFAVSNLVTFFKQLRAKSGLTCLFLRTTPSQCFIRLIHLYISENEGLTLRRRDQSPPLNNRHTQARLGSDFVKWM
jgi:hypothetical protein